MYCGNCGKKIPDDSRFCPECGAPVKTPVAQKNQESHTEKILKPAEKLMKGHKVVGKKKTIMAIVAVAVIVLLIAIPVGIHNSDLSRKFENTAQSMENSWPRSTTKYYDNSNPNPIPTEWPEMDYEKDVKTKQRYTVKGSYDARFLLVHFNKSSECDAVLGSYGDDPDYEVTADGYRTDYADQIRRIDRKGNYIFLSQYSEASSGLAEEFISEVGF